VERVKKTIRCIVSLPAFQPTVLLFCFLLIGFLRLPPLVILPQANLDSWITGLHIASQNHWQFGYDFVYTFGPLNYLFISQLDNTRFWAMSVAFQLCIHWLLLASCFFVLFRSKATWREYLIAGILLLIVLPRNTVEYQTILLAGMWLTMVTLALHHTPASLRHAPYIIATCSLLLAISSLIKFNAFVICSYLIVANSILWLYRKKYWYLLLGPLFYCFSILSLWVLSHQQIGHIWTYIILNWKASGGYNEAMNVAGSPKHLAAALLSFVLLAYVFVRSVRIKDYTAAIVLFNFGGFIFVLFKHGFVRHDAHDTIYFSCMCVFLLMLYALSRSNWNRIGRLGLGIVCLMMMFWVVYHSFLFRKLDVVTISFSQQGKQVISAIKVLTQPTYRQTLRNEVISKIKNRFPLKEETLRDLHGKSMDIFPWDIALPFAYGLDWKPRFTLQSFAAYTPELDQADAGHFQGLSGPQRVLFAFKSIDCRYPAFDEPQTFACLLNNYRTAYTIDTEFVVLEPKSSIINIPLQRLSEETAHWGELVFVPKTDSGLLFAKIHIEYSWLGKVFKFVYKPPPLNVTLTTDSGHKSEYRFISAVARGGIFVSQFIRNTQDLATLFSGKFAVENRLKEISFDMETTNKHLRPMCRWMYRNEIHIIYYIKPMHI
jgi:hypothetical protein